MSKYFFASLYAYENVFIQFEIRQLRAHLAQQDLDLSAEREVALQMHRLWGKRNGSFQEVDRLEQRGAVRAREPGEASGNINLSQSNVL